MKRCAGVLARPAVLCTLLALAPARALAQDPDTTPGKIVGRVLDDHGGKPVAGVALTLSPSGAQRISDAAGDFVFQSVPPGVADLRVEHLAYGRTTRPVNVPAGGTVQLELRLVPRAIALDSIVVHVTLRDPALERGGYYDRKSAGWGQYLEGRDLERPTVTDIMRGVPRVDVVTGRSALDRIVIIREAATTTSSCAPDVYIDHLFVPQGAFMLDEILRPGDVKAVEVYRGVAETPGEFIQHPRFRPCGAILIWTKH